MLGFDASRCPKHIYPCIHSHAHVATDVPNIGIAPGRSSVPVHLVYSTPKAWLLPVNICIRLLPPGCSSVAHTHYAADPFFKDISPKALLVGVCVNTLTLPPGCSSGAHAHVVAGATRHWEDTHATQVGAHSFKTKPEMGVPNTHGMDLTLHVAVRHIQV